MTDTTTKTVLLVGRRQSVIDDVTGQLHLPRIQLLGGTDIDAVRNTFTQTSVDHVIMGAGIDLDTRLEIIRQIFQTSDTTTVHMKDRATGPDSFLPFIASVLRGLDNYH
jgi:hypothetical protein